MTWVVSSLHALAKVSKHVPCYVSWDSSLSFPFSSPPRRSQQDCVNPDMLSSLSTTQDLNNIDPGRRRTNYLPRGLSVCIFCTSFSFHSITPQPPPLQLNVGSSAPSASTVPTGHFQSSFPFPLSISSSFPAHCLRRGFFSGALLDYTSGLAPLKCQGRVCVL